MSASDDVDKMMSEYREKALASRTRFQRFVDFFGKIPMPTYFIVMFTGVFLNGSRLNSLDLLLRSLVVLNSPDPLTGFQQSILIHLWFIPPIPAQWNSSLLVPGVTSVFVGFTLFIIYFISRRVAYKQTYYVDLGFLGFFLLGIILLFTSPKIFATLYYYYPASLVFLFLAVPPSYQ